MIVDTVLVRADDRSFRYEQPFRDFRMHSEEASGIICLCARAVALKVDPAKHVARNR